MKTNQLFSLDCGSPPGHKKTPTNDGTFTLESERFSENCHSTAGAYEETLFNYINGTELKNKLSLRSLNVFEVGFGLGIGPLVTFQELNNYPGELNFYSSELDENLIHWFKSSVSDHAVSLFPFDQLIPFTYQNGLKSFKAKNGNRTLEVFIGDLTKIDKDIENILGNIHAIYQDPFSPKKNPELWSQSWFETLKKISHPEVILSTYSASHSVHENLSRSGWHVTRAPGFAHKRSSTRATLQHDIYQGPIK